MEVEQRDPESYSPINIIRGCFGLVLGTSLCNVILFIYCWSMLEQISGQYYAEHFAQLLSVMIQTGIFCLLLTPVYYLTRHLSSRVRNWASVVTTLLYLGLWVGLNVWFFFQIPSDFNL